jgi:hypothetical protein
MGELRKANSRRYVANYSAELEQRWRIKQSFYAVNSGGSDKDSSNSYK